jgi:hypothetical protein
MAPLLLHVDFRSRRSLSAGGSEASTALRLRDLLTRFSKQESRELAPITIGFISTLSFN